MRGEVKMKKKSKKARREREAVRLCTACDALWMDARQKNAWQVMTQQHKIINRIAGGTNETKID